MVAEFVPGPVAWGVEGGGEGTRGEDTFGSQGPYSLAPQIGGRVPPNWVSRDLSNAQNWS